MLLLVVGSTPQSALLVEKKLLFLVFLICGAPRTRRESQWGVMALEADGVVMKLERVRLVLPLAKVPWWLSHRTCVAALVRQ